MHNIPRIDEIIANTNAFILSTVDNKTLVKIYDVMGHQFHPKKRSILSYETDL